MDFGSLAGSALLGVASSDYTSGRDYGRQRHERRMSQAFQERMSNTAFQRQADDLKAAGLNRIYGLSKGMSGASTPTAASPQVKGHSISAMDMASATKANTEAKILNEDAKLYKKYPWLRALEKAMPILASGASSVKTVTDIVEKVKKNFFDSEKKDLRPRIEGNERVWYDEEGNVKKKEKLRIKSRGHKIEKYNSKGEKVQTIYKYDPKEA